MPNYNLILNKPPTKHTCNDVVQSITGREEEKKTRLKILTAEPDFSEKKRKTIHTARAFLRPGA